MGIRGRLGRCEVLPGRGCGCVGVWGWGEPDPAEAGSEQMIPDLSHPASVHFAQRRISSTHRIRVAEIWILSTNLWETILMKIAMFKLWHHVRLDISSEISGDNINEIGSALFS